MEKKEEKKPTRLEPRSFCLQHSALPLGQTGSHREEEKDKKKEEKTDIFKPTLTQPKAKPGPIVAPDDGLVQ